MTTTALIGTVVASFLIVAAIAILIFVVRALSRPSRRIASPSLASAPHTDPAPTDILTPASPSTVVPSASPAGLPYARIPHLLTPAEGDFFAALQAAMPAGMLLFAQVRLANLVKVQAWARGDKSHWWRIQAKCVDFVVCEPRTFIPHLVIELDDSSHNRADRRERDSFVDAVLAAAGLPILHVRWQPRYDPRDLAQQIAIKLPSAQPTAASLVPLPAPAPAIVIAPLPISAHPPTFMRRACGQCQAQLSDQSKFCAQCGTLFAHA